MRETQVISILQRIEPINDVKMESFLADLGIDSVMVLEFIVLLEEHFHITFSDEDLVGSNFQTVQSVVDLVNRYIPVA